MSSTLSSLARAVSGDDACEVVGEDESEREEEETGDGLPSEGLEEGVERLSDGLSCEFGVGGDDVGVSGHALLPGETRGSCCGDPGGGVASIFAVVARAAGNLLENLLGEELHLAVDVRVDGGDEGVEEVNPKGGDESGKREVQVAGQEIRE